jgi:protease-4
MQARPPGVIRRTLKGCWDALDFTRRLVFNLVFLALLVWLGGLLFAARPLIAPHSALLLDPDGAIVEQYSVDPLARALGRAGGNGVKEVQLRDLLRAIDAAAKDARIDRIVLVPDRITHVGLASAHELGAALDRFRAAGKDVVAVSAGMEQDSYLVAAHADRILLDPEGSVMLEGLASYRSYFKDALDKLGVDVHLIKVGAYKSAAEPLVLNQASQDAKTADAYWMGGLWHSYLDEVARLRKLDGAKLADSITHLDRDVDAAHGDLAQVALREKLVDALATRADAWKILGKLGVSADDGEGYRHVDYQAYLADVGSGAPAPGADRVAIVVAEGEIAAGEQPQGAIGAESTAALIRAARTDERVKAVVLRIDSPGGDATASELIRREVAATRAAGKPVVVSMGDVAASGGYWIAMDADAIWADPQTITGSIGIFGLFVTIPDALAKFGIHTDGVATTPLAGALDIRRPLSPELESILTNVIERGYREFVGRVAKARARTPAAIDAVAQGRVWSGSQARERGLVDHLGGLEDAIAAAAKRAKLGSDYGVGYVEKPLSAWESLALGFSNSHVLAGLVRAAGVGLPRLVLADAEWRHVSALVDSLAARRFGVFAQCFCELR